MNVQSNFVQNRWVEGHLYRGDNTFMGLFKQKILDKEGLRQWSGVYKK